MKKVLIVVVVLLAGVGAYVGMNWTSIMTGFMTASVDPTAQVELKTLEGTVKGTRYIIAEGEQGDESPLPLEVGMVLKANDKLISDGEKTKMVLALDAKNSLELRSADFILKSLFGEESKTFSANIEEGELLFKLGARGDREVFILDTNKNKVEVLSDAAEYYMAVTSFEGTLNVFVKSGEVKLTNGKTEKDTVIKAGAGVEVGEEGKFTTIKGDAEWVTAITW